MQKPAAQWVVLVSTVLLAGCSTFNRDWERMAAAPAKAEGIEGRWDGKWNSEQTGHSGRLRCILSKKTPDSYWARFKARYGKLFTYEYSVPLKVDERDGKFNFEGEANLHWWAGGVYNYKGAATTTNFFSTYRCKHDHGTFDMIRP